MVTIFFIFEEQQIMSSLIVLLKDQNIRIPFFGLPICDFNNTIFKS